MGTKKGASCIQFLLEAVLLRKKMKRFNKGKIWINEWKSSGKTEGYMRLTVWAKKGASERSIRKKIAGEEKRELKRNECAHTRGGSPWTYSKK